MSEELVAPASRNPARIIIDPMLGRWTLRRAFWLGVVLGGIVVFSAWIALPPIFAGWDEYVLLTVTLLWLVWSMTSVWNCARHSGRLIRYLARASLGLVLLLTLAMLLVPHPHDYTTRHKILEGVNISNPARTALGIACMETDLLPGMSNYELGLVDPAEYNNPRMHSVEAFVDEPDTGRVVVVFKAIGNDVEDGQTVVYHGVCDEAGMRWSISGSVPAKFRPKG